MSIRASRRARRGLSFVEFVGCVFAITGGIVLGSMYFGIDVEEAAVDVLQYAELMPSENAAEAAAPSASPPAPAPVVAPTSDGAEQVKASANAPEATAAPASPPSADDAELTPETRLELTRNYWEALIACMQDEVAHRAVETDGGLTLHSYLARRHEGHRQAAEAIDKLKLWGVDGHVAAFAKGVLAWHEAGAEMYSRASALVTDAPTAKFSGPFADQWKSAVTQHQMEERLLAEKHAAVQAYLNHASK
ncbi:MAG TPA: hypothetical protein VF175_03435 [Lacipirellula sp.]